MEYELKDLKCRVVDPKFASSFICKYHYSHTCPPAMLCAIGEYYNDKLVNCIVFSHPVTRYMSQMIWEGGNDSNTIELARMVSLEPKPKNLESYSISKALSLLMELYPKYKVCVSYADNAMGHYGYCYQASNFICFGQSAPVTYWWIDGKRIHPRTVYAQYGTNSVPELKKVLGDRLVVEPNGPSKTRYYKILATNKKEKREIEKLIKVETTPYPKGEKKNYVLGVRGEWATNDEALKNEIDNTQLFEKQNLFW